MPFVLALLWWQLTFLISGGIVGIMVLMIIINNSVEEPQNCLHTEENRKHDD